MTYNQYIKLFKDIAANHRDINGFGNGELTEYVKGLSPVVLWVDVLENPTNEGKDSFKFTFLVMDQVNKITDNQNENSNTDEVLSDTNRIAKDIIAILRQPYYETYFLMSKSITLTDFRQEKFDNEFCGWQFDITFDQPFLYDSCQANITSLPTITGTNN